MKAILKAGVGLLCGDYESLLDHVFREGAGPVIAFFEAQAPAQIGGAHGGQIGAEHLEVLEPHCEPE
jgi:hypothetical protein